MLTFEDVSAVLLYDPETGSLTWKQSRGSVKAGAEAGSVTRKGYIRIAILGERHHAHRIAWLIYYKEWPNKLIDHWNLNKLDNSIKNLRLATDSQNQANSRFVGPSGYRGVSFYQREGRWRACIKVNYKNHYLGLFDTAELASDAYQEAAARYFGEFRRNASAETEHI